MESLWISTSYSTKVSEHGHKLNMKTILFEVETEETKVDSAEKEEDVDTHQTIETVMEDSLKRATKIITSNKKTSVSTLKSMARKRKSTNAVKLSR